MFEGGEAMGLFTKYCALCGMKIEKDQNIVRFGKHFDSEQHVELYAKQREESHKTYDSQRIRVTAVAVKVGAIQKGGKHAHVHG